MGSWKRKETSRDSPWGLVVRSSCTGKVSTGSFSWEPSRFLSQSGRYWTDPLGTALVGELVGAVFCCWSSSVLEGFAGLWFTVAFSPLGVGACELKKEQVTEIILPWFPCGSPREPWQIPTGYREFPGSPAVRTQCFHCHEPGSTVGWRTEILTEPGDSSAQLLPSDLTHGDSLIKYSTK